MASAGKCQKRWHLSVGHTSISDKLHFSANIPFTFFLLSLQVRVGLENHRSRIQLQIISLMPPQVHPHKVQEPLPTPAHTQEVIFTLNRSPLLLCTISIHPIRSITILLVLPLSKVALLQIFLVPRRQKLLLLLMFHLSS